MRVGRALSILLDPTQEPLFEDQGPFTLLPEEYWHAACMPRVDIKSLQQSKPEAATENGDDHHTGDFLFYRNSAKNAFEAPLTAGWSFHAI